MSSRFVDEILNSIMLYHIVNTMMKNNDFFRSSSTPTEIPPEPWGFVAVASGTPTEIPPEPW